MEGIALVLISILGGISGQAPVIATDIHLVESTRLPVYLTCDKRYGYIEVGGVTINAMTMSEHNQKYAVKECENQLKEPWKLVGEPKTTCHLTFGKKFEKKPDDIIRVLYRCFDTKPPKAPAWNTGNEKDKVLTAIQKEPGKEAVLRCQRNKAIIVIKNTYINNVHADTKLHPSLDPSTLRIECYGQWLDVLSNLTADKSHTTCKVMNKDSYGGELKIEFMCTYAPKRKAKEVVKPVGKLLSLEDVPSVAK